MSFSCVLLLVGCAVILFGRIDTIKSRLYQKLRSFAYTRTNYSCCCLIFLLLHSCSCFAVAAVPDISSRTVWNCITSQGVFRLTANCVTPTANIGWFSGGVYVNGGTLTVGGVKKSDGSFPVIDGGGHRIFVLGNNGKLQLANIILSGAMGDAGSGVSCPAGGGSCSNYPSCGCSGGTDALGRARGCCCGGPRLGGAITAYKTSKNGAGITGWQVALYAVIFTNNDGACAASFETHQYAPDIYLSGETNIAERFALVKCEQPLDQLKIGGQASLGAEMQSSPDICTDVVDAACIAAGYDSGCGNECFENIKTC